MRMAESKGREFKSLAKHAFVVWGWLAIAFAHYCLNSRYSAVNATRNGAASVIWEMKSSETIGSSGCGFFQVNLNRPAF